MTPDISIQKKILRNELRNKLRTFSGIKKISADSSIRMKLLRHPKYLQSSVICCYVSLSDEVDTIVFIKNELKINHKKIIIPRVHGATIDLFYIKSFDDLEIGTYGILEPKRSCELFSINDIDLFIVPGLAFDFLGRRLGRGKGFIDMLLQNVHTYTIGLAYEFQIVASLPTELHDVQIQTVLSNSN